MCLWHTGYRGARSAGNRRPSPLPALSQSQYRAMLDDFSVCALHVHIRPARPRGRGTDRQPSSAMVTASGCDERQFAVPPRRGHRIRLLPRRDQKSVSLPGSPALRRITAAITRQPPLMAQSEAMLHRDVPFWDISAEPAVADPGDPGDGRHGRRGRHRSPAVLIRALVATADGQGRRGDPGRIRRRRCCGRRTGGRHVTAGRAAASTRSPAGSFHPNPGPATRRPRKACPAGPRRLRRIRRRSRLRLHRPPQDDAYRRGLGRQGRQRISGVTGGIEFGLCRRYTQRLARP